MTRLLGVAALLAGFCAAGAAAAQDERPAGPGEWGFRPADGAEVERTPPSFSWRPQKDARDYELEASRDPAFERVDYRAAGIEWSVHCPPEPFEAGEWVWRFRAVPAGGEPGPWSSTRRFTVPEQAAAFTLPGRGELLARIPAEHPRLFVRPEDLPRLRAAARGELGTRFGELVARCEELLAEPPPTVEPERYPEGTVRGSDPWRAVWWGNRKTTILVLESAATLAFTWRLGGREELGALARRLLLEAAAWDPKGATGYRYNDEAGMPYAYHFSRAYTFVHPLLTEAERERCRTVMRVRGREMYAHLAPRHLWQPYSSHSNRAWHFLGEVGIAFHGEVEEAGDWVWFAANVFANVYPAWSGPDGGWHEGTAYWSSYLSRFTWWADVQRAALGLDAYQLPFFSRVGDFALYTMPPGTKGGGFGDLNARRTAEQNRQLMTVFASQAEHAHWRAYVDRLGGPDPGAGYVGFLRSALPEVEPADLRELPTSRLFRGTGQAVLNTSLVDARDNVEVIFKSSPFGSQSHGYEAQNSFLLYAFGERLLIRSGYRDSYGSRHHREWMWQTKSTNNVTAGGRGQRPHSAGARGRITAFHTGPGVHYVEGEAGEAYDHVEGFRRGVLLLEPDLIVIHDRLRAPEPTTWEWHLHAPAPFEPAGDGELVVRQGGAACRVTFLAPADLRITRTDRFEPPPRERVKLVEHHLTATTAAPSREASFLTVVRPFRVGAEPPGAVTLGAGGGRPRIAAPLGGGSAHVEVLPDGSLAARVLDASLAEVVSFRSSGAALGPDGR